MTWTLADIRSKVRNITGSPSSNQISDATLNDYINQFYVYTMPAELKTQIETNFLDFKTIPGQDVYSFPSGYFTDQPGIYADGFPCVFYQDPDVFYQDWPQQYAVNVLATGDGTTSSFSGNLQNPPLIIGSLFISDNNQVFQDNGLGVLVAGNDTSAGGSGTINYVTGAYTVNFSTTPPAVAPPASATIYAKYIGYSGNRPSGCLFFENEFTLRPVPDQVYQMHMQGFIQPATLSSDSSTPLQQEWGIYIAYGASLDIFSDRGDMGDYKENYSIFKRYESVAISRTVTQLSSQQSVPRF